MTLLIVIECNLIGIKRDFFLFDHELSHLVVCNFSEHSMSELFETSNKITSNAQVVIRKLIMLHLR